MRKFVSIGALLCAMSGAAQSSLGVAPSIEPLATFGGGDGWLAPGDRTYLTTGNLQRGLAYNPTMTADLSRGFCFDDATPGRRTIPL